LVALASPPPLRASRASLTPSLPPSPLPRLLASSLLSSDAGSSGGGGDIKPDLVRQYLSSEQHSASQRNREALAAARESFATHAHDVGGTEVQIAALTERIRYMTDHLRTHRKDKASRLGLVAMLERRKKLLKYLRRSDGDSYGEVIYRLGLKDRSFVEDKYLKK
jgi:ribosomal protein S15